MACAEEDGEEGDAHDDGLPLPLAVAADDGGAAAAEEKAAVRCGTGRRELQSSLAMAYAAAGAGWLGHARSRGRETKAGAAGCHDRIWGMGGWVG